MRDPTQPSDDTSTHLTPSYRDVLQQTVHRAMVDGLRAALHRRYPGSPAQVDAIANSAVQTAANRKLSLEAKSSVHLRAMHAEALNLASAFIRLERVAFTVLTDADLVLYQRRMAEGLSHEDAYAEILSTCTCLQCQSERTAPREPESTGVRGPQ